MYLIEKGGYYFRDSTGSVGAEWSKDHRVATMFLNKGDALNMVRMYMGFFEGANVVQYSTVMKERLDEFRQD